MTTIRYNNPFFERENSTFDIVQPQGTQCPFDILFGSLNTAACKNDGLQNTFLIKMNYEKI